LIEERMKEKGGEGEGRGRAAGASSAKRESHGCTNGALLLKEECALSTGQKEKAQQKFK
jgi:hypothetical protein